MDSIMDKNGVKKQDPIQVSKARAEAKAIWPLWVTGVVLWSGARKIAKKRRFPAPIFFKIPVKVFGINRFEMTNNMK